MRIPRFISSFVTDESASSVSAHERLTESTADADCGEVHGNTASPGTEVLLSARDSHHLTDVLRLSPGVIVEVFLSNIGKSFTAEVITADNKRSCLKLLSEVSPSALVRISLIIGITRPKTCEEIVEKCTEAGCLEISFFRGERSSFALSESRLLRLQKVRDAAVKQSFTTLSPALRNYPSLLDALGSVHQAPEQHCPRLLLRAPSRSPEIKEPAKITTILQSVSLPGDNSTSSLELSGNCVDSYLLLGPEGGFSPQERETALSYGYQETTLGPNVLRTETAAPLSCILAQLLLSR